MVAEGAPSVPPTLCCVCLTDYQKATKTPHLKPVKQNTPVLKPFKGIFPLSSCFLSSAAPPEMKNFHVARPAAPAEPASDFIIQYFSRYFFKGGKKGKKWKKYWVKHH